MLILSTRRPPVRAQGTIATAALLLLIGVTGIHGTAAAFTPNPTLASLANNTARDLGAYTCNQPADNPSGCDYVGVYGRLNYDPFNHRLLMFGGGHATSYSSTAEVFNIGTLTWSALSPSTLCSNMVPSNLNANNSSWIDTGQPLARHTWDMMIISDWGTSKKLQVLTDGGLTPESCSGAGGFPGITKRVASLDLTSGTWSYSSLIPGTYWYYASAAEFDPVSKRAVIAWYGGCWIYDPATDTATPGPGVPSELDYSENLVYFPPNQKMYYIKNNGIVYEITLNRSNFAASTVTQLSVSGSLPSVPETGFAYDSANGIIGGGIENGVFYAFDPVTRVWTSRTMQSQAGSPGTVEYHCIDYDPVNNVFFYLNTNHHTWAYRFGGGAGAPDTVPPSSPSGVRVR